jgi:predicted enzyme related to lactoylglutathione lyase
MAVSFRKYTYPNHIRLRLEDSAVIAGHKVESKSNIVAETAQQAVTGSITAIGIGISDLAVSQAFYSSAFDYSKGSKMSFGVWDEAIMMAKGGGPALIPMKFKNSKSVKNLPVKLTFHCPDPKTLQAKVISAGGKPVDRSPSATGAKEGTLYATDPDGYLLELIPGGKGIGLSSAGYGSSNLNQSAAFFSKLAGTTPGETIKQEAWDMTTVKTTKEMTLQFLDFRDDRNTKELPLKIVWGVSSIPGFKTTITQGGGTIQGGSTLGGMVGMAYSPIDKILIEINSGAR